MKFLSDIEGEICLQKVTYSINSAAYLAFGKSPDNKKPFRAKLRMRITSTVNTSIFHELLIEVVGTGNTAPRYRMLSSLYSTTATNTGVYYIRFVYPKALNNGYFGFMELYAYDATARTIDVELYEAENFELLGNLTASIYNATYHSIEAPAVCYSGEIVGGTIYGNFSGTTSQCYYLYYGATPFPAGIAMSGGKIAFLASDGKFYPVTQTTVGCYPNSPIVYAAGTLALNASVYGYDRYPVTITNTYNMTLAVGKDVFIRGTYNNSTGLFTSDGTLTQTPVSGYAYRRIGVAYNTTQVFLDTNTEMFVLSSNGNCTNYNGRMMSSTSGGGSADIPYTDYTAYDGGQGVCSVDLTSNNAAVYLDYDFDGAFVIDISALPLGRNVERKLTIRAETTSTFTISNSTGMSLYGTSGWTIGNQGSNTLIEITFKPFGGTYFAVKSIY